MVGFCTAPLRLVGALGMPCWAMKPAVLHFPCNSGVQEGIIRSTRVAAFVTFHYRRQSLQFLDRVLRNLADFDVRRIHVTIVTNAENAKECTSIDTLCRNYFGVVDYTIESFPNCEPGTLLTWKHKPLLAAAVADSRRCFSHFIYVEGDIGLSYRNFQYFTEHADALRERGLIPSFLRVEFSDGTIRSCDAEWTTVAPVLVRLLDCTFASPRSPYCACFIMDRLHVSEYLSSRSFDYKLSEGLCSWGVPERAAMGLCWEKPPPGFSHRYVLPVDLGLRPLPYCEVPHMPANYASIAVSPYGKIPVESVFVHADRRQTMYVVTAHNGIVGTGNATGLIQSSYVRGEESNFVEVDDSGENRTFESGPLLDFTIQHTKDGVYFLRDGSFLCAEPGNRELVANRAMAGPWETFFLISKDNLLRSPGLQEFPADEVIRFGIRIAELVAAHKPVKICFGCGPFPRRGFLNLDVAVMAPDFAAIYPDEYFIFPYADMSWGIPDDCIDYLFHECFIEHITQLQQIQFLAEAWRVLKPDCYHRVNTPNMITSMKRHSNFKKGFNGVYTGEVQWGHISIFSPNSLKEIADLIGYRETVFTTKNHGVSPFAEADYRPWSDRDEIVGNIYADLQK
jgi:hypothetical protein